MLDTVENHVRLSGRQIGVVRSVICHSLAAEFLNIAVGRALELNAILSAVEHHIEAIGLRIKTVQGAPA